MRDDKKDKSSIEWRTNCKTEPVLIPQISGLTLEMLCLLRYLIHILPIKHGRARVAVFFSKIFLPKGKLCVPLITGAKMVLDFNRRYEIAMCFDIFADYISELQVRLLRPGDIFVDCGANVGYYSFLAAPIVTKTGKVIAIDVNSCCIERMEESKAAGSHDNVEIKCIAIGEKTGQLQFNIADDSLYSSFSDTNRLDWTSTKESISVKVEPLDRILENVCTESDQKIRLLKLDVEGAEIIAMLGAKNLLETRKIDYIYVELHPAQLKLMGHEVDEFHFVMKDYGYHPSKTRHPCVFIYSSPDVATYEV
jgi:FkbM family methyltransferase